MSRESAISGYEFCSRVLEVARGDAGVLIEEARGREADWLEFKAACEPVGGAPEKGHNRDDYRWHVAKAVVAMANTHGGCVLLGVDDSANPSPLAHSDPGEFLARKDADGFFRHLSDAVLRPKAGWKCEKAGEIRSEGDLGHELIELKMAKLMGQDVVAILVKPVPAGSDCIVCVESIKQRERYLLLVRDLGEQGRILEITNPKDVTERKNHRQPEQASLADKLSHVLARFEPLPAGGAPPGLEARIATYHARLREKLEDLERVFVDLDAEERTDLGCGDETYQPWAEEYFEPDTEWEVSMADNGFEDDVEYDEEAEPDHEHRVARRGGVFDLLTQETRAVLLGDTGAGKTTCLKRLASRGASAYKPGGLVCIFVPLSRYNSPGVLFSLLVRSTKFKSGGVGLTEADLEWLIRSGRLVVLLDALNECPESNRIACQEEIRRLLLRHPDLHAVISARSIGWAGTPRLPAFTVQPMDAARQEEFICKSVRAEGLARRLLSRIQELGKSTLELGNPLLLQMAISVFRKDDDLPQTQALLYRRVVGLWYEREANKALKSGSPLPWDEATVREALAFLAFESRRDGGRIIVIAKAEEILTAKVSAPSRFLACLGHGFLFRCEDDEVDFGHESYQEYFAAEFWCDHPEALSLDLPLDKTIWAMVLVQSAQLGPLPAPLGRAAWHIDPWLGATVDPRKTLPTSIREHCQSWEKSARNALQVLSAGDPSLSDFVFAPPRKWYQKTDKALCAAVLSSREAKRRWLDFEVALLHASPTARWAAFVLRGGIIPVEDLSTAFSGSAFSKLRTSVWVASAKPEHAVAFVKAGICNARDFDSRKPEWIASSTPGRATALIESGICTAAEFEIRRSEWITSAKAGQAFGWVTRQVLGFTPTEFRSRRPRWIATATPKRAATLVSAGICTAADFDSRRQGWIAQATPEQAANLVAAGICSKGDFDSLRPEWLAKAYPERAAFWVRFGIMGFSANEFDLVKPKWIAKAKPERAATLVRSGLCHAGEFDFRKQPWTASATPEQAAALVRGGVWTADDFISRKPEWIGSVAPEQATRLVNAGICTVDDFESRRPEWIAKATPEQAAAWVKRGIFGFGASEFDSRRPEWIARATLEQAASLVNGKFMGFTLGDFEFRRPEWIAEATPERAAAWVKRGILGFAASEFGSRKSKWIAEVKPEQAAALVKAGICTPDDFSPVRPKWIANATAGRAAAWVKRGILGFTADEFDSCKANLIACATPEQFAALFTSGICTGDEIASRQHLGGCSKQLAKQLILTVKIYPKRSVVARIAKQVKADTRACGVFRIAKKFLEKPEHYRVRVSTLDPSAVIHQVGDGPLAFDRETVEREAFRANLERFYETEVVQGEAADGNYTSVARERLSGMLLGPPNYPEYDVAVRKLYEERYNGQMSISDFEKNIEILSDPAIVGQWKQRASCITTYKAKTVEGAESVVLRSEADAERHFRATFLPRLARKGRSLEVSGVFAGQPLDPIIAVAVRDALERESQIPLKMVEALRPYFSDAKLHLFKSHRNILFVSAIRPQRHPADQIFSESISEILAAIGEHPGIMRPALAVKLLGSMATDAPKTAAEQNAKQMEPFAEMCEANTQMLQVEDAPKKRKDLAANLHFLIREGYVVEFENGALELPCVRRGSGNKQADGRERPDLSAEIQMCGETNSAHDERLGTDVCEHGAYALLPLLITASAAK